MKLSIVIPNFNGVDLLSDCLHSLLEATKPCRDTQFEIILVDNGSTDSSVATAKCLVPQIKTIKFTRNLGFAAAANAGIRQSTGEYIVLCNNDLTLDSRYFLSMLKAIKLFPDVACFCGTILNKSGKTIESQGISFNYSGKCLQNHHFEKYHKAAKPYKFVWGSTAALVVYKKSVVDYLGGFDERYFAYLEDVDFAFRLHQNQFKTLLVSSATCNHLGGGTSNRMGAFRAYQTFRNWFILIFKNYSFLDLLHYFPVIFLERLRNFSYLLRSILLKSNQ